MPTLARVSICWFAIGRLIPREWCPSIEMRFTVCCPPAASSLTLRLALRSPSAVGVNWRVIVRVVPGARVAVPLSVVMAKSPASAAAMVTRRMVSGAVPLFVRVMLCGLLEEPSACDPKLMSPLVPLPAYRLAGFQPILLQ
jgi:hypothetical protein